MPIQEESASSSRARCTDSLVIPPIRLSIPMPSGAGIPAQPTPVQRAASSRTSDQQR